MKGRARAIFLEFQKRFSGPEGTFKVSRVILLSKVVPEELGEDLDDPDAEKRLQEAIFTVTSNRSKH